MNVNPTNTFVFDLDGVMVIVVARYEMETTEQRVREKFGEGFLERHRFEVLGQPLKAVITCPAPRPQATWHHYEVLSGSTTFG